MFENYKIHTIVVLYVNILLLYYSNEKETNLFIKSLQIEKNRDILLSLVNTGEFVS